MPKPAAPLLSKTLRRGVLAAVATPVHIDGTPDLATFGSLIEFVAERGVDSASSSARK
jgi:dihydrodipicolinate synthase/N-acetylneuraminate lyase